MDLCIQLQNISRWETMVSSTSRLESSIKEAISMMTCISRKIKILLSISRVWRWLYASNSINAKSILSEDFITWCFSLSVVGVTFKHHGTHLMKMGEIQRYSESKPHMRYMPSDMMDRFSIEHWPCARDLISFSVASGARITGPALFSPALFLFDLINFFLVPFHFKCCHTFPSLCEFTTLDHLVILQLFPCFSTIFHMKPICRTSNLYNGMLYIASCFKFMTKDLL